MQDIKVVVVLTRLRCAENRNLPKCVLTCHLTLRQRLEWTWGHHTYTETQRDKTSHSPDQSPPDTSRASARSANEKPSQPMLPSSSWSPSMYWLKTMFARSCLTLLNMFGLEASLLIPGLRALLIQGGKQESRKGHRLTYPNTTLMGIPACHAAMLGHVVRPHSPVFACEERSEQFNSF